DGAEDLADFRLDGAAWILREGALERQAGRADPTATGKSVLADAADTVALFSLPVTVEGEWSGPPRGGRRQGARLAVGVGGCFVALGGPGGPIAWRGEPRDCPYPGNDGQAGAAEAGGGRFR